jgi:hypothetical protein
LIQKGHFSMPNLHRGEIEARLGGRTYMLCLTLGALAELETAFGVDDLAALGMRFAAGQLSARDLIRILGAGLRGGGTSIHDDEVAAFALGDGLEGAVKAAVALLAAAFGTSEVREGDTRPPMPSVA